MATITVTAAGETVTVTYFAMYPGMGYPGATYPVAVEALTPYPGLGYPGAGNIPGA